ncbi:peptide-methionine (R)-S-oxide reductase [Hasllibacter halocynthiae]|uniref:peptide-methionine (R)-S-oxide reductase n=1 Tax=Hasllibacter halocynthiae TaxID=595589 RepID=A0A2T0X446_9RHOB|nr:peptide-methionine (R)-S-oxide reductase MsrB [Hasllibacter halocynthiae]PRY93711.1 peptide-methionine (R)-S-oxide reductase [Hasllibacter halocynthiae]
MPTRRSLIIGGSTLGAAALVGGAGWLGTRGAEAAEGDFPLTLTEAEWRARLTPEEFAVLREEATEPPHSSPLDKLWEDGTYACAGCGNALYSSENKFDSGTGWPSFWQPIAPEAVGTRIDYKLIYPRTEVHCARCGGHQGHIFEDGPAPTGLRHCINGVALDFVAA